MRQGAMEFFLYNQGGCYAIDATPEQRAECDRNQATRLALAEAWAWEHGYTFDWSVDEGYTSAEWASSDNDPYEQYACVMRSDSHGCVQSLGGIDFGRGNDPWTTGTDRKLCYRRLVEAELALEQMETRA